LSWGDEVVVLRQIGHRLAIEESDQGGRRRVAHGAVQHIPHCHLVWCQSDSRYLCEGSLLSFEHNSIARSDDNTLHDGAGCEVVLDGIESAAYTFLRGKEHNLIARLQSEATEADKLECAAECHMSIYCQEIVLVGGKASHLNTQCTGRILGVVISYG